MGDFNFSQLSGGGVAKSGGSNSSAAAGWDDYLTSQSLRLFIQKNWRKQQKPPPGLIWELGEFIHYAQIFTEHLLYSRCSSNCWWYHCDKQRQIPSENYILIGENRLYTRQIKHIDHVKCYEKRKINQTRKADLRGFPGGPVVKSLPANAGDMGSIWEDPMCRGATKSMRSNYRACGLGPLLYKRGTPQWEARTPQWREAPAHYN